MEDERVAADPRKIKDLSMGACPSLALLAGMQLGIFSTLKDRSMTNEQIADAIGADSSRLMPLLYALVVSELLTIEGDSFSNTIESNQFLVKDSPSYMADHACFNIDPLMMRWALSSGLKIADTIRTGVPQCMYDFSAMSEEDLETGFRGTLPIALRAGRELATRYDFSSYRNMLDVGGGIGGLSIAITESCPQLTATVADLDKVVRLASRIIEESGAANRVRVMPVDVVQESLSGSYDVAVLRAFIQVLPPDVVPRVLENINTALEPGCSIYIVGHILDNSRTSPIEEVWYSSLNINFYDNPGSYTKQEYWDWISSAGLQPLEHNRLPNGDGVITAKKPE